jgi:transposase
VGHSSRIALNRCLGVSSRMQGKVMSQDITPKLNDVGIDVCKDWLDVHLMPASIAERFPNEKKGHTALLRFLKRHNGRRILIEATGKYHRSVHEKLHAAGLTVIVINPSRARKFAESIGTLAKTDTVDARMLALFAGWTGHEATPPLTENLEKLQEIVRSRAEAVADRTALLNQLCTVKTAVVRTALRARIVGCKTAAQQLSEAALKVVAADPALQRRFDILVSIPGIAATTAASLLADMPELGQLDEKAVGMLAGLAPIACESGQTIGVRRIRGGRVRLRTACYMPALQAARCNGPSKIFFQRLVAAGKSKKVALTAVMRKLRVLANALLKADRIWSLTAPVASKNKPIHA